MFKISQTIFIAVTFYRSLSGHFICGSWYSRQLFYFILLTLFCFILTISNCVVPAPFRLRDKKKKRRKKWLETKEEVRWNSCAKRAANFGIKSTTSWILNRSIILTTGRNHIARVRQTFVKLNRFAATGLCESLIFNTDVNVERLTMRDITIRKYKQAIWSFSGFEFWPRLCRVDVKIARLFVETKIVHGVLQRRESKS